MQPKFVFNASAAICALLVLSACNNATPVSTVPSPKSKSITTSTTELVEFPDDPGVIQPWEIQTIAPKVGSLQAEPSTIHLKVGDMFSFTDIKVTAFDSNKKQLGRLTFFNSKVDFGVIRSAGTNSILAVTPGETSFKLIMPMFASSGGRGNPPEVIVNVVVSNP